MKWLVVSAEGIERSEKIRVGAHRLEAYGTLFGQLTGRGLLSPNSSIPVSSHLIHLHRLLAICEAKWRWQRFLQAALDDTQRVPSRVRQALHFVPIPPATCLHCAIPPRTEVP
jgi:hypothetical protein